MSRTRPRQRLWLVGGAAALVLLVCFQLDSTRRSMLRLGPLGSAQREDVAHSSYLGRLNSVVAGEAAAAAQLYQRERQAVAQAVQHLAQPWSNASGHAVSEAELRKQCHQLLAGSGGDSRGSPANGSSAGWGSLDTLLPALGLHPPDGPDSSGADSALPGSSAQGAGGSGSAVAQAPAQAGGHRLCVVVPYRQRPDHLAVLAQHLRLHLARQRIPHKLLVVEQLGGGAQQPFNRGFLLNAGFLAGEADCHYYALHDVDLLPLPGVPYAWPGEPGVLHLARAASQHAGRSPYARFAGGALLVTARLFRRANGYSNGYWAWGGEDDDFALRVMREVAGGWQEDDRYGPGCALPCAPPGAGGFVSLEPGDEGRAAADVHVGNNRQRLQQWQDAEGEGPCKEGLSTLAPDWPRLLRKREEHPLYTLLQVELPDTVRPGIVPEPSRAPRRDGSVAGGGGDPGAVSAEEMAAAAAARADAQQAAAEADTAALVEGEEGEVQELQEAGATGALRKANAAGGAVVAGSGMDGQTAGTQADVGAQDSDGAQGQSAGSAADAGRHLLDRWQPNEQQQGLGGLVQAGQPPAAAHSHGAAGADMPTAFAHLPLHPVDLQPSKVSQTHHSNHSRGID